MTDFETHPAGTAARIEQLEANTKELGDFLAEYMAEAFTSDRTATELREALTRANAATAAAYEVAAREVECGCGAGPCQDTANCAAKDAAAIRALATPDQTAALDRLIAEAKADALSGPWEDKPDAMTATVEASYPHITKDYDTYTQALELVSSRRSKGALVALVNHLLAASKKGGV